MTNDSIFQFLWGLISQVLQKANDFKIYIGTSYSISVIQFFLSLSIMAIVLRSLINFVSSTYVYSASETVSNEVKAQKKSHRKPKKK